MGGTYPLSNFVNRDSDYPMRRKLTPVEGQDNVYDVSREEGTVRIEGTPWGATTMNKFDEKISEMFPVSIANGGTGGTDKATAINNFIISGSFAPDIYSSANLSRPLNQATPGTKFGYYYKLGRFVYVDIVIKGCKGSETDSNGAINIGKLPYPAAPGHQSGLLVSEFALYGGQSVDRNRVCRCKIVNNEYFIKMTYGDGGLDLPVSLFGTGDSSTSSTLDAIISGVYITT